MRNSELQIFLYKESYAGNSDNRKSEKSSVHVSDITVREKTGMTMNDVVALLADEYGWSTSVSNLSDKLRRESLRYREAVELADVLDYDIVWQKRR